MLDRDFGTAYATLGQRRPHGAIQLARAGDGFPPRGTATRPGNRTNVTIAGPMPSTTIYSISNERFFLGLVALINSLRLHGHDDEVVIVDCGLTKHQRDQLAAQATLLRAPPGVEPHLLKYVGPLQEPADVMLLIDADMLITSPLDPIVADVRAGKVVAFADPLADRFFESWQELLDLPTLRRQPYVNAGFLGFPRERGLGLLERLRRDQTLIETEETIWTGGSANRPTYFADQDLLNALLASVVPSTGLAILEQDLAPHPPFMGVRVVDVDRAACAYADGRAPFLLHHMLKQKPWLTPRRPTAYSDLLPRLWLGDDVAIRLNQTDVPLRFRAGLAATAERRRAAAAALLHETRGRLGLRRYVRARRRARQRAPLEPGPS